MNHILCSVGLLQVAPYPLAVWRSRCQDVQLLEKAVAGLERSVEKDFQAAMFGRSHQNPVFGNDATSKKTKTWYELVTLGPNGRSKGWLFETWIYKISDLDDIVTGTKTSWNQVPHFRPKPFQRTSSPCAKDFQYHYHHPKLIPKTLRGMEILFVVVFPDLKFETDFNRCFFLVVRQQSFAQAAEQLASQEVPLPTCRFWAEIVRFAWRFFMCCFLFLSAGMVNWMLTGCWLDVNWMFVIWSVKNRQGFRNAKPWGFICVREWCGFSGHRCFLPAQICSRSCYARQIWITLTIDTSSAICDQTAGCRLKDGKEVVRDTVLLLCCSPILVLFQFKRSLHIVARLLVLM